MLQHGHLQDQKKKIVSRIPLIRNTWSADLEEVVIELPVAGSLSPPCLIADVMEYAGSLEKQEDIKDL